MKAYDATRPFLDVIHIVTYQLNELHLTYM